MTNWTIGKKLGAGFGLILLLSACVAAFSAHSMRQAAKSLSTVARADLPEVARAAAFEREILNARIHFIYHVTIQKPGALDLGWERFRKAQALTPKLGQHVAGSKELAVLRQPTESLAKDLAQYEVILRRILDVAAPVS